MFKLVTKKHNKLTTIEKKKIIFLKKTFWNYTISEHNQFLIDNFKNNDYHNLFFYQNRLIGYTAFRKEHFFYKSKKFKYFHMDTLLILKKYRNKKLSKLLMSFNEFTIKKNSLPSIFFTRKALISFYKKFGWKTNLDKKIIFNLKKKPKNIIMTFGLKI